MKVSVQVKTKQRVVKNHIKQSFADYLNQRFARKNSAIKRKVASLIYQWVKVQPEMVDLQSGKYGKLGPQFGIPAGESFVIVDTIARATSESFDVEVRKVNKNLVGGVYLNFIPDNFGRLLALPEGHVITEKGADLHWMDWLNRGYETIVTNYKFLMRANYPGSRGGGLMIEKGTWRVPPEYAGTEQDNFITRAITMPGNEKQLLKVIEEYVG